MCVPGEHVMGAFQDVEADSLLSSSRHKLRYIAGKRCNKSSMCLPMKLAGTKGSDTGVEKADGEGGGQFASGLVWFGFAVAVRREHEAALTMHCGVSLSAHGLRISSAVGSRDGSTERQMINRRGTYN